MHKAMLHLKELSYYFRYPEINDPIPIGRNFFSYHLQLNYSSGSGQISEFKKRWDGVLRSENTVLVPEEFKELRFLKSQQTFWSLICSRFLLICNRWQSHYCPRAPKYTLVDSHVHRPLLPDLPFMITWRLSRASAVIIVWSSEPALNIPKGKRFLRRCLLHFCIVGQHDDRKENTARDIDIFYNGPFAMLIRTMHPVFFESGEA